MQEECFNIYENGHRSLTFLNWGTAGFSHAFHFWANDIFVSQSEMRDLRLQVS